MKCKVVKALSLLPVSEGGGQGLRAGRAEHHGARVADHGARGVPRQELRVARLAPRAAPRLVLAPAQPHVPQQLQPSLNSYYYGMLDPKYYWKIK